MTRKLVPTLTLALLTLALLSLAPALAAGEMAPEKGHYFTTAKGVFLDGYDVVAYFDTGEAMKGKKKHSAEYEGVTFRFSSEDNLERFEAAPEKYLPQYGGWCAYGVGAAADKFEVDPHNFKMVDGKLYLFYNGEKGNTLDLWNQDEKSLMQEADSNWERMQEKEMMKEKEMMGEKEGMGKKEMMKEEGMKKEGKRMEGKKKGQGQG